MSAKPKVICVGSRKSELALIQTKHVIALLQKLYPEQQFEIHTMTTMGDRVLNISLPKIGEKALFTKDLEDALHSGRVDFVVHSLKDLPTALPRGMAIGAILEREDPRDALVLRRENVGKSLTTLPKGSVIGTSSLRRGAQLARKYPHLVVQDIRGNLNTRLAKLDADGSKFAGIILAQAGLARMGWKDRINETLSSDDILYAVGQGALAVECRSNDTNVLAMLRKLSCLQTQCKILTERSFLKTLGGGCSAPVAVITDLKRAHHDDKDDLHYELHITGAVWSLDGTIEVQSNTNCALNLAAVHDDVDNNNEILPSKRAKLTDSPPLSPPQADAKQRKKPASPTIVDDSRASCSSSDAKDGQYDIKKLLDIHGNLFKKCPYAVHHQAANDADKCPLSMAVGQDVMGQCPYFNADQKSQAAALLLANDESTAATTGSGCPFVKAVHADGEHKGDGDAGSTADKCPFISAAKTQQHQQVDEVDKVATEHAFVLVDVDHTRDTEVKPTIEMTESDNVTLYCGLFRHRCYRLDVFEKCEELGRSLAKNLIANGALKVMEKAQLEIRKKV